MMTRLLKLEGSSIHQAAEEGIAIVYQELTLVPGMTVGENIFLGKEPLKWVRSPGIVFIQTRKKS